MRDPGLEEDDEMPEEAYDDEQSSEDDYPAAPLEDDDDEDEETLPVATADKVSDLEPDLAAEEAAQVLGEQDAVSEVPETAEMTYALLGDLLLEYKHWTNPRQFTGLDDAEIRRLAADIRSKSVMLGDSRIIAGVKRPLLVVKIAVNGSFHQLVIDGQRRFRACHEAGFPPNTRIPVEYRETAPVEWSERLAKQYLAEVLRAKGHDIGLSAYELSESAVALRGHIDPETGKEYTIAGIADVLGRSSSWVSKILIARGNATAKILSQWRTGAITEEQFHDLARAPAADDKDKKAEEIAASRKGGDRASISDARREAKEGRERARLEARAKREEAKKAKAAAKAAKVAAKKAKAEAKKGKGKGKGKKGAVAGPQLDLPAPAPAPAPKPEVKPEPAKPTKPRALPFAVVDDLLTSARAKPPTHDLVKGVLLGIQVAAGLVDMGDLPKPWQSYIQHLAKKGK